jgi:DNA-directed RNA polymerase subunit beta'
VYSPIIRRRLRQGGTSLVRAAELVKDKSPDAKRELLAAMKEHPVIMSRAPVLHKYGIMAFWPTLTKDKVIKVSPLVVSPFAMDFDGDTSQFHVPIDEEAKQQAIDRILPSKNLISPGDFKSPNYTFTNEYSGGIYSLTNPKKRHKVKRVLESVKALREAYARGDIEAGDDVEIVR